MHYLAASLITVVIAIGAYMFASEVFVDGSNRIELILLCISVGFSGYSLWIAIKKRSAHAWVAYFASLTLIGYLLVSFINKDGSNLLGSCLLFITAGAIIWSSRAELKTKKLLEKNK